MEQREVLTVHALSVLSCYIKIDVDQEMGQEYSTIVLIIVKADRGKAIA